jgi:hypothetical protein
MDKRFFSLLEVLLFSLIAHARFPFFSSLDIIPAMDFESCGTMDDLILMAAIFITAIAINPLESQEIKSVKKSPIRFLTNITQYKQALQEQTPSFLWKIPFVQTIQIIP